MTGDEAAAPPQTRSEVRARRRASLREVAVPAGTMPATDDVVALFAATLDALTTPVVVLAVDDRDPDPTPVPLGVNPGEFAMRRLSIRWANRALLRGAGVTPEDVFGMTLTELRQLVHLVEGTDPFDHAMLTGERASAVVHGHRDDGVEFWWRATLAPIRTAGDAPVTHWVAQLLDMTQSVEEFREQTYAYDSERRARQALHVVSRVSDCLVDLASPLVLRDIADLVANFLGGWVGVYLDEGGLRFAEGLGGSGSMRHEALKAQGPRIPRDALGDSDIAGVGTVVVEGPDTTEIQDPLTALLQGRLIGPVTMHLLARYMPGTMSAALLRDLRERIGDRADHLTSLMLHAIPGREGTLGVLVTALPDDDTTASGSVDDRTAPWALKVEGDATLLELVTRRVGMAIENVQLYRREHQLAETLQRAMLPEQVVVEGLDVWTYYAPTSEHAQVGGDWYDVLQMTRTTTGIVIGDVVGHDIEAAATMGQLRSVVRAYAYELVRPGIVLDRVDRLVVGMHMARLASLVYATLTQVETGWTVEYARAGHLPPLRVRAGEAGQLSGAGGALVGYGSGERATATVDLVPGDVLVFYTDGLIERRDADLREGLFELAEATAASTARDAAGIGEALLARFADASEDDVALVIVRVPDPVNDAKAAADSPRTRRWTFPSEPASIARARQSVVSACTAWGMPHASDAELVVSELVANAVLHGWGYLTLRLFDTGEGLHIEVEDANPAPPVTTQGHPNRTGGYGMQIVERLADWGWRAGAAGRGKVVWARMRTQTSTDGTARA